MNVMKLDVYKDLKDNFITYKNALSIEECDEILELQKSINFTTNEDDNIINSNYKNCDNLYSYEKCIIENEELEQKLIKYAFDCNVKIYGYDIWGIESDFEFYTFQKNNFFDYHENILWYSNEPSSRKLTCILFLSFSEPQMCKGGELVFDKTIKVNQPYLNHQQKGTLLIFPSFLTVKINNVEEGIKQFLKFDIIGPRFK